MNTETLEYTKRFNASCDECDITITTQADVDLDSTFEAYDEDSDESIMINGWLWDFEEI